MPELSLHNIDQISRDVTRQEISFSHLLEDLIDHVCCDVEYEMQSAGLDFTAAYMRVKQKMGSRRLKEIQEETLYVVDLKYRQMKNTMKISGIAGTIMLGFSALFKINHWPLAGVLMTLGAVTLAFVFMPSALGVLWKETHSRKKLFLFISAFMAGMCFILGTLFKVQHWPGAGLILLLAGFFGLFFFLPALLVQKLQDQDNKVKRPVYVLAAVGAICYGAGMLFKIQHWPLAAALMVFGLIILCLIALPWYTWLSWKEEGHITSKFLYMLIGLLLILLPGSLINMNLSQTYDEGFYSHQDQQKALYGYLHRNTNSMINLYHDSSNYSVMQQIHERTIELIDYVGGVESEMISVAEGKPGAPVILSNEIVQTETGPAINYHEISRPFHTQPVKDFLLPGSGTREALNALLTDYKAFISGLMSGEELRTFSGLLDLSLYLPDELPENSNISMMSGLHSLELLKNGLLTVESGVLKVIANHK
ncbi:MAG: hypothetical protein V1903_05435 [Bacteroidota bacterium]